MLLCEHRETTDIAGSPPEPESAPGPCPVAVNQNEAQLRSYARVCQNVAERQIAIPDSCVVQRAGERA